MKKVNEYIKQPTTSNLEGELEGLCQLKNTNTLLSAIRLLKQAGYQLTEVIYVKGSHKYVNSPADGKMAKIRK